MPIHTDTKVINMNPSFWKKACLRRSSQHGIERESIHGRVRVWVTCNDIILTRVTPHCHRAFFSPAREIDISFTNIPCIFFSRPVFFGGLSWRKKRAVWAAPPSDGVKCTPHTRSKQHRFKIGFHFKSLNLNKTSLQAQIHARLHWKTYLGLCFHFQI